MSRGEVYTSPCRPRQNRSSSRVRIVLRRREARLDGVKLSCYTTYMRKRKRFFPFFLISLPSFVMLIFFLFTFPPESKLRAINYELSTTVVFFLLLFLFIFSIMSCLLQSARRGLFLGVFVCGYFFLRLIQLRNMFFLILLALFLFTLELFFSNQK